MIYSIFKLSKKEIRDIIVAITATSLFIYLDYFGIKFRIIDTIFGLISIYYIINRGSKELFWVGFGVGIAWFWWITLSYRYYDLLWLIIPTLIFIGLAQGIIFAIFGYINPVFRVLVGILFFDIVSIFGFDWFKLELLFVDSFFGIEKLDLFIILVCGYLFGKLTIERVIIAYLLLVIPLQIETKKLPTSNLKISITETNIEQDIKWNKDFLYTSVEQNLNYIDNAIKNRFDIIILPENAFPTFLNKENRLLDVLYNKSRYITIVTGGLSEDNGSFFNSTYMFQNGKYSIANKSVLVPFGEEIPLPSFMRDWINKMFFDGASDYKTAKNPTDFEINGTKFRNAICYEATNRKLFQDYPKFMIAISNNAWFVPSIEPNLQAILMRYYSKRYNTVIYHSTNKSDKSIIN
jgi:apolipoprotein N-acyltransferase